MPTTKDFENLFLSIRDAIRLENSNVESDPHPYHLRDYRNEIFPFLNIITLKV